MLSQPNLPELHSQPFLPPSTPGADTYKPIVAQLLAHILATPHRLFRTSVGYIPCLSLLYGTQHTGAVGVAGTFRQMLTEACLQLSHMTVLTTTPNTITGNGDNKQQQWVQVCTCYKHLSYLHALGTLMGIAIRSGCSLDILLHSCVYRLLKHTTMLSSWSAFGYATESSPTHDVEYLLTRTLSSAPFMHDTQDRTANAVVTKK